MNASQLLTRLYDAEDSAVGRSLVETARALSTDSTVDSAWRHVLRRGGRALIRGGTTSFVQLAHAYGGLNVRHQLHETLGVAVARAEASSRRVLLRVGPPSCASPISSMIPESGRVVPLALVGPCVCWLTRTSLSALDLRRDARADVEISDLAGWSLCSLPQRNAVVTWTRSGRATLWHVPDLAPIRSFDTGSAPPLVVASGPEGTLLTYDKNGVLASWSSDEGRLLSRIDVAGICSLAVSPKGQWAVAGTVTGAIVDLAFPHLRVGHRVELGDGQRSGARVCFAGPDVAVACHGSRLARVARREGMLVVDDQDLPFEAENVWFAGGRDRIILSSRPRGWTVWNVSKRTAEAHVDESGPGTLGPALAVSHGGALVAKSGSGGIVLRNRRALRRAGPQTPTASVMGLWSDRDRVVSADFDGNIRRRSIEDGSCLSEVRVPKALFYEYTLSMDSALRWALTVHEIGGLVFWDLERGVSSRAIEPLWPTAVCSVPCSPGEFIVAADGELAIWSARTSARRRRLPAIGTRILALQVDVSASYVLAVGERDARVLSIGEARWSRPIACDGPRRVALLSEGRLARSDHLGRSSIFDFDGDERPLGMRGTESVVGMSGTAGFLGGGLVTLVDAVGGQASWATGLDGGSLLASPTGNVIGVRTPASLVMWTRSGQPLARWDSLTSLDACHIVDDHCIAISETLEEPCILRLA